MRRKNEYYYIKDKNFIEEGWDIGKSITIDKANYNYRYQCFYKRFPYLIDLFYRDYDRFLEKTFEEIGKNINNSTQYDLYRDLLTEIIFEYERLNKYSQKPSRLSCVYLCEANTLPHWYNILNQQDNIILKVRGSGKIHRGHDYYLLKSNRASCACEIMVNAKNYWEGKGYDKKQNEKTEYEILFEGKLEIINIYEKLDEIDII